MNKIIIPVILCAASFSIHAQIRTANSATNVSVANSPAFIDASSNTTVNGSSNVGKGLIFPRVDLSAMTAFPAVTAGIPNSFPTRFDGMVVYNTATSGTAGVGATAGTLSAGFWYYDNKSTTNTGGTWKPVSASAAAAMTASNGLTAASNDVKLGGTLTQATTVTNNGNSLNIAGTAATTTFAPYGYVGIGNNTPNSALTVTSDGGGGGSDDDMTISSYNTTPGPAIYLSSSRGTKAAPLNLASGSKVGEIVFTGQNNNGQNESAAIRSIYTGDGTTNQANLLFNTSGTERMRIAENGNVGIGTASPGSLLQTNGSFATKYNTVAANTTLDGAYHTVNATHTSGAITLTLPAVSGITGRQYTLQNSSTGSTNVVVAGGGTVDGLATLALARPGQTAQLIAGDNEWKLITNEIKSSASPSGLNIYNSDGTLTSNRNVNIGANSLNFNGAGNFSIGGPAIHNGATYLNGVTQTSSLQPGTNNSYSIGASTLRYQGIWATYGNFSNDFTLGGIFTVGGPAIHNGATYLNGVTQTSSLQPGTNNSYSIGASTLRYQGIWATYGNFSNDFTLGGIFTVGGPAIHNGATYLNGITQTSSLQPGTNNSYSIGASTLRYQGIWATYGNFSNDFTLGGNFTVGGPAIHNGPTYLNDITQTSSLQPSSNNTSSIGASTLRYQGIWATYGNFSNDFTLGNNLTVGGPTILNGTTYLNATTQTQTLFPGVDATYVLGASTKRYTAVYAVNGTIQTSDLRLKKDIKNTNYGLMAIMKMRPVEYNWKDGKGKHMVGFIAQEMEKIVPEAVDIPKDPKDNYGMNYNQLIPVLTKAIQEQQSQIETLKGENQELKSEMAAIKKKIGL